MVAFEDDEEDAQTRNLSARRTRLYRINIDNSDNLCNAIALKTLKDPSVTIEYVRVGETPSVLAYGESDEEPVAWTAVIKLLTSVELGFTRATASAALIFRVDETTYAITFGHGWRYVRESAIDRDFGLEVAVRLLNPDEIRKITRWALSAKSRVDQNTVPGGQGIWAFGLREHAGIVRNLTGKVRDPLLINITYVRQRGRYRNFSLSIECGDGVHIPLGIEANSLLADLQELNSTLHKRNPHPRLEPLQWVRPISQSSEIKGILDSIVADFLAGDYSVRGELGIAYPAKYYDGPDVQRFKGTLGDTSIDTDELTLEHLSDGVRGHQAETKLRALNSSRIEGFDDSGNSLGGDVSALHWMSAEIVDPKARYILLDGDWYELGDQYIEHVDRVVNEAFANIPDWILPAWIDARKDQEVNVREETYNSHVAKNSIGFLCLDQKLIRTRVHPHGFEACDLLSPENYLVHVKKASSRTGSSVLSHLFAQGLVAIENLTNPETWEIFRRKVAEQSQERAQNIGERPSGLVYAIHMPDRELTPQSLFTFARSTLVSASISLAAFGIPLQIAVIP